MGGHGLYVWLSYGIVLVLFIINLAGPLLRKKQLISELTRRLRREQKKHESKA